MKRFLWLLLLFVAVSFNLFSLTNTEKIDINQASLEELETLPISDIQANAIYNYRTFTSFFESIYDLRKIAEIDQQTLLKIKPLITVSYYTDLDETEQRREEIDYLIERLGSQEGIQEGFSDIWEDYLMTPQNINQMYFSDILNMPNVSPIDAVAISKRIAAGDTITDYRNLRSTTGLSHYGATNLRHYIYYVEEPNRKKLFSNYQFKYENLSFDDDTKEMYREIVKNKDASIKDISHSYWGFFKLDNATPAYTNKFRVRYANNYKFGLLLFNQTGEKIFTEDSGSDVLKDAKYYASYENKFNFFGNNDIKIFAGNYRVTYGEGLVIENTDYYSSRKTGHGFSKRITGITGDLSRSQEYALKGIALELKRSNFCTSFWYSNDKKDAVVYDINNDGLINENDQVNGKYHIFSYITPTIRFDNDDLIKAEKYFNQGLMSPMKLMPRMNFLDETMLGARVEYNPLVGTHIGLTSTQTIYDNAHFVSLQSDELRNLLIRDLADFSKWKRLDSQISNMYSTYIEGEYERDYRQVMGLDWRTVVGNTSFQGEYAELKVNGNEGKIGDDPSAIVMSTYTQFENFYFLALYRDYDIDFDNPYARGFSEHRKFNDTILNKNIYALTNQLLADVYLNSSESQAEKGIYFETRYKISTYLTLNRTYIDIFERKADGRRTVRFQGDIDYRPIYQLSLRGKYKHQINRYDDDADRGVSETSETSAILTSYLSNRDRLQFEYRYTQVKSPPYPYLTNEGEPTSDESLIQAQTLMHGDFIRIDWTHNLNSKLRLRNAISYWNGHSVSHWDWEDIEIDFLGEHGIKYWFLIQNKIANNLYISLKYKLKFYRTKELFFRAWWNESLTGVEDYYRNVDKTENAVRLQIDWRF
jgi:hypothetical protein